MEPGQGMRSQKDGWKWRQGGAAGRQKSGLFVLQMTDIHMCQALEFHLNCGDSDRTVNQVTTAIHFKRLMKRWLPCRFRSFPRDSAPCLPCGQHCHASLLAGCRPLPLWPPYPSVLFIRFLKVSVGLFAFQVAGM